MRTKVAAINLLIIFILFVGDVLACSPPPARTDIHCSISTIDGQELGDAPVRGFLILNDQNQIDFREDPGDAASFVLVTVERNHIRLNDLMETPNLIDDVLSLCAENMDRVKPILIKEIETWYGGFYPIGLTIEPYSADRERSLQNRYQSYRNCTYPVYKKVGDWLVSWPATREYCLAYGFAGMCPSEAVSDSSFFIFLITHPNRTTLPYLLPYLLVLSVVAGFSVYVKKHKRLASFFSPGRANLGCVLTVFGFLILLRFLLPPLAFVVLLNLRRLLILLFVVYLLGSVRRYFKRRNIPSRIGPRP